MDALAGLLDGPRARQAFLLRSVLTPPWSLRIQDEAPLTIAAVCRGEAWIVPDDGAPIRLGPGDVMIARGPEAYTVADHPDTPPQVIIWPGQRCTTLDGRDLHQEMELGVRSWGNDPGGEAMMLTGTYQLNGEVNHRLLRALPPLLVLTSDSWDNTLVDLLSAEMIKDLPGQTAVLDRLLDLVLIATLRAWFDRSEAEPPRWYRAQSDPVVGRALRMLHNSPTEPWTLDLLAGEIGISRAALARRFKEQVGEPVMSFLTGWRLALAADLLRETDHTIGAVAERVGYSSPFALSTAFKRAHGISPKQYRQDVRQSTASTVTPLTRT